MGASRWFFSFSGVILVIGALALGGKGLNFGIDFESGTRITAALRQGRRPRTSCARVLDGRGPRRREDPARHQQGARQQRLPDLDQDAAARRAEQGPRRARRRLRLRQDAGHASIGPTFGNTVAKSAVIAIIASLLVISAYIALRFEWKYAVPVLIALMHDILITVGRLRPHRPGGDDVDGRGAADHPGLLALRHDHRVRPRARERAAHAARRVLADRQPLDERGADAIAGDDVLHAACRSSRCCCSAARR